MKNKKKSNPLVLFVIVILLAIGFLAGCDDVPETLPYAKSEISAMHPYSTEMTGYACIDRKLNSGKGVYYFPCASIEFATALGEFVRSQKREGNEVVAIASDNTGPYGSTKGFHVVTRPCNGKCEPPSGIDQCELPSGIDQ